MAVMQDTVMASTLPAAATIGKTDASTRLSPSITTITINELAHSGSESSSSSFSSPSPGDHHHNSSVSQNVTPAMHNHSSTEKQAPHLLLNNGAPELRTSVATNDNDIDADSTNKVVQMAVDELRAMGETLRRATKQQQRLIEETMSQWRQEQHQEQQEQHHYQNQYQYQQQQQQQYYPQYQYRQSASPGYYGNGDHDSPTMSAGSATAVGSSQ